MQLRTTTPPHDTRSLPEQLAPRLSSCGRSTVLGSAAGAHLSGQPGPRATDPNPEHSKPKGFYISHRQGSHRLACAPTTPERSVTSTDFVLRTASGLDGCSFTLDNSVCCSETTRVVAEANNHTSDSTRLDLSPQGRHWKTPTPTA